MPSAGTQRYLGWIGAIGVFTACFGCGLLVRNDIRAGIAFLIGAQLILVPLFLFLMTARRRTKRVVRTRSAQRQAELDALGEAFGPAAKASEEEGKE